MQHVVDHDLPTVRAWVDSHLKPKRWRGDEAAIRCPLPGHKDTHESASANPVKRVWYCHACDTGDTLFQLAKELGVAPPPPLPPLRRHHRRSAA